MSIDLDAATPTTPEHQAEQALLAAMLLSENAVHTIMSRVDADDFSPGFNQAVFGAMVDLIENGSNIDIAPVTGRLMEMGQEDPEGIKTFLLDIARTRPMAKTVKSSIGVIKEAARRRKISAAADNVRLLATTGGDIEGAMQEMILASSTQTSGQVIGIGAGAELMIEHLQAPIVKHVRTGLPDLDHLLNGGFRPGQLITVGARPGVGKSAFALGIAYQAVKDGLHVLYVTAEMGVAELLLRLLARTTKIPLSVLTSVDVANELSPGEWDKIGKEAQSWVNYHMDFIDDAPTVLQIRSKAKAAEAQVRGAQSGHQPRVNAFASLDYDYGPITHGDGRSYGAGVLVQWDLWDGWATRGKVREAEAGLQTAREEERKLRLALNFEIEQARRNLSAADERLLVGAKTVEQATQSAEITRHRFEQGTALPTQLLDAESALVAARVRRAQAEADQRIAVAALRQALALPQLDDPSVAQ